MVEQKKSINFLKLDKLVCIRAEKIGNTALVFLKGISKPVRVSRAYYKMLRAKYLYK